MGYWERPGGIWSGDYMVIDIEKAQNARSIKDIRLVRTRDIIPQKVTTFPVAEGTISFACDSFDGYREREALNKIKWVSKKKKKTPGTGQGLTDKQFKSGRCTTSGQQEHVDK